ncbi:STAS domain-containing protein [Sphingomonas sp. PR090111-T3T-6A]|uniref:STAS domain-containing protein n=1 Tax=Sphingomonas sp. PR090111-T3T-6A TaxID=685778 RepID=UPI0003A9AFC7|nr:STAS domain-containing protein [Sphingomonas sp. PR090111-T3T-6A]
MDVMDDHVVQAGRSVTVRSVAEFHASLLSVFGQGRGDVVLDLSDLGELDLSFIQIVEATRKQFAGAGRGVRLLHPADGPVAALLARAGFDTSLDAIDFWFHGELQA